MWRVIILMCSLMLVGCGIAPKQQLVAQPVVLKPEVVKQSPDSDVIGRWLEKNDIVPPATLGRSPLLTSLYQHYETWQGVRYQPGGMSMAGVDCSGFAKLTFAELFGIDLPRNTTDQSQRGIDVAQAELRSGDLVFFRIDRRTQHVGIYLQDSKFLHASTTRGVEIADIQDQYWRTRYWKSVRIPEL